MTKPKRMTAEKASEIYRLLDAELKEYGLGYVLVLFGGDDIAAVTGPVNRQETIAMLRKALRKMQEPQPS